MSVLDNEIERLLSSSGSGQSEGIREIEKASLAAALPRLPFNEKEFDIVAGFLKMWRLKGHQVILGPYENIDHEERIKSVKECGQEGLVVMTDVKNLCELIIFKVDDGRNIFGFKRHRYNIYISSPGDRSCVSNGTSRNLAWTISKFGNVVRS